ncbi:MAG: DUF3883 domain-containing protein [Bacteroidota bacterium]
MDSIFKLHPNSVIGYKRLSPADLGWSSGNTTHIGLFENTLTFLPRKSSVTTAQLVYNQDSTELVCLLDYIQNPDGSIRSPKIRKGKEDELVLDDKRLNSIVRAITGIASQNQNSIWYLLWFGLDNEDLVFFLFNNKSNEYAVLNQILTLGTRGQISKERRAYPKLLQYLNTLVTDANSKYLEELEIIAQTREETVITKRIKPRRIDIAKANQLYKKIGETGEELIFEYLKKQKKLEKIRNFKWMNQSKESGYPYDFEITYLDNKLFFTDVKSTVHQFQQKMIFSSSELLFISQNENYQVHRVFGLRKEPKLRICNNIHQIIPFFIPHYKNFKSEIEKNKLYLNGLNIGVPPTADKLKFDEGIDLSQLRPKE